MSATATAKNPQQTIRLPMPHRGQQVVRSQAKRFNWLCAGRRFRKTTMVMPIAVEGALAGQQWLWCAPTYKQVRIGWDEARHACGAVATFNESRMDVTFPGGGRIRYVTLDNPDNARGMTADGIEMDEASEIAARAWGEVLRPMLMDTGGVAWFTFTPKGRNWTWTEWLKAQDRADSAAWQIPTVGAQIVDGELVRKPHPLENPFVSWDEIQQLYETLPERVFRQEILAEFLDDAGGVFRNVEACVGGELLSAPTHPARQYVVGVDLAKHQDYTVCVVADRLDKRVVAFDRWNKADWPLTKARIMTLAKKWNNALLYLDSTGIGDVVYDDLRAFGLRISPFTFTASAKEQLVNHAVLLVEQKQVSYPRIPVLLAELKALEYSKTPAGRYRMAAPEGLHDDAAMAFCLCCWGLGHGSTGKLPTMGVDLLLAPVSEVRGPHLMGRTF